MVNSSTEIYNNVVVLYYNSDKLRQNVIALDIKICNRGFKNTFTHTHTYDQLETCQIERYRSVPEASVPKTGIFVSIECVGIV